MVDDCEDCAPEDEKIVAFREKMDCLSLRSSRWVISYMYTQLYCKFLQIVINLVVETT